MSHVRVVATLDTCVHIVFRTWTSGVQLYYMKLRPDGTVAIEPRSTLLVSPNPMFSLAKMQFNLTQPSMVQLILYDALGRKVRDILNCAVAKSLHTIQFDRADLSSGTYFLVFKKDSESRVVKIVIVE